MFNITVTSQVDTCRTEDADSKLGVEQHLSQGLVSLKHA